MRSGTRKKSQYNLQKKGSKFPCSNINRPYTPVAFSPQLFDLFMADTVKSLSSHHRLEDTHVTTQAQTVALNDLRHGAA